MNKKIGILIFSFLTLLQVTYAQEPKLVIPIGLQEGNGINLSPDGKYIVSVNRFENRVIIWETASGKIIHYLKNGSSNGYEFPAVFTNDNKYVIAVARHNVYVWDVITEILLYTIDYIDYGITNFKISSDQKNIITSGWDGLIKTWDLKEGKLVKTFGNKNEEIGSSTYANFSPDQKYVITAKFSDTIAKVWDAVSGDLIYSLKGLHKIDYGFRVTFSPENKMIITKSYDSPVQLWNEPIGRFLDTKNNYYKEDTTGNNEGFLTSVFSQDGKYLILNQCRLFDVNYAKTILVCNVSTSEILFSLEVQKGDVLARISPDNRYVITSSSDGNTNVWQLPDGKLIYNIKEGHTELVTSMYITNDSKYCVTGSIDNTIKIWSISFGKLIKTLKGNIGDPNLRQSGDYQFSLDSKFITSGVRNWDITSGKLSKIKFDHFANAIGIISSPLGKYIMCDYKRSDTIKVWDVLTNKILFSAVGLNANTSHNISIFSPDDKYLLTKFKDTLLKIWDLQNGKLLNTITLKSYDQISFTPDGKSFVTYYSGQQIKVWETSTGNLTRILKCVPQGRSDLQSAAYYSHDGKIILQGFFDSVKIWNAISCQLMSTLYGHNEFVNEVYSSPDGKYIISGTQEGVVKIWDAHNYRLLNTLSGWNILIKISPDGKYFKTRSEGDIQRFWSLGSGTLLYSLIMNNDDYLVFDKDFRFDGTPAARDLLYYVCGNEIVSLEQFKNLSWEPGLVSKIMGVNKEPIIAKGLSEINICNYTPKVEEKGYNNGKYNFEITPRGGGLSEILLFVNNKQIKTYSPGQLIKKEGVYQLEVNVKEIKEYLLSGEDNNVEVVALTADKEMKSQRSVIEVKEKLDKNANVRLYAISVGISKYKDDKLKLTYASKDAEDFSDVLNKAAKKFLDIDSSQHVFTFTFSTGSTANWPSKENIKKAFEEVAKKATADDILVLFLAGHGTLKTTDKKFYFLTQEASSFGFAGVEKEVAISTDELNDWMSNIKAQKQILVLDACSSGEVVSDMQQLITKREIPADQVRALERLKDRTGTYILSASASGQAAYESRLYEQGLLTYSLLSGLKYGRGLKDNKFIDVSKWFNAAADEVKVLAKDIGGRQDPQIIGSTSFDIGIVDRSIADSIKLTSKKKIFKRSRFIGNATLLNDDLELSSLIDKELNELSVRGIESPIVYVDDDSYADNYSLRGSYKVINDQVRVIVTLFKGQKERLHQFEVRGKAGEKDKMVKEIINKAKAWIEK